MNHRLLVAALVTALVLPLLILPHRSVAQLQAGDQRPDKAVLQPGQGQGVLSATGYLSPPTEALHPFTHMLLRREAQVPDGAAVTLSVRASVDGQSWTGWGEVTEND